MPLAPAPPGKALSDFAGRNSLLEFQRPRSLTAVPWSVPAFLPDKVSTGTPFLRLISLRGIPPQHVSLLANI